MSTMTPEEAASKLDLFAGEYAALLCERVKQKTPVLSGHLRDGWYVTVDGSSFTVGNMVEYAPFVEFGTVDTAPVGML